MLFEPNVGGVIASQVIDVREGQFEKAYSPILVTLLGITMEVREGHSLKANSSMFVTLLGMVIDGEGHPLKAYSPILVTLLGMTVFWQPAIRVFVAVSIIALQFSRLSYTLFSFSTMMVVRFLQSLKRALPIFVTLLGIVIEVREVQLQNAN